MRTPIGLDDEGKRLERTSVYFDCKACGGTGQTGTPAALPDCMTYTQPLHTQDQDCIPNADGECLLCHTVAGDPCPACAGVRFHLVGCPMSDAPELGPMLPAEVALERGIGRDSAAVREHERLTRMVRAFWRPDEAR